MRVIRRVLVTGGAGFVGSHLVRLLVDEGAEVTVLDNLVNGRADNLADVPCRLVVADVRQTGVLDDLLGGVDTVFHLACLGVRHSIHSPEENHHVNATGTLGCLLAAERAGVERFVHVSTSEVYGTARTVPMTEDHPTFPHTVYGASKLAGEAYARARHASHGFPTVVIRPFNAYGPRSHHEGDSGEVIPRFMLRAMAGRPLVVFGDGAQTRDFTWVGDTAVGLLASARAPDVVGRTINLGSGTEHGILALARLVGEVVGRPVAIEHDDPRPGDVRRLCADGSLAGRLLNFTPRVSLRDGLHRLHDWLASQPDTAEALLEQERVRNWL